MAALGACLLTALAASGRLGNLPWHTMVTALLIAELVKHHLPVGAGRTVPLVGATVLAAMVGVVVIGALGWRRARSYESETALRATAAAAALVEKHPHWVILADNLDAAALEWHDPQLSSRIAYDARVELYSEQTLMPWAIFQSGYLPGWRTTTNRYQVLVGATGFRPRLVQRLKTLPAASSSLATTAESQWPTPGPQGSATRSPRATRDNSRQVSPQEPVAARYPSPDLGDAVRGWVGEDSSPRVHPACRFNSTQTPRFTISRALSVC